MEINKKIFREYDIRGIYPKELDESTAYLVGRAFGTKLQSFGKKQTVLGYDNRLSSKSLEKEMLRGLIDSGIEVIRLGLVTTPMCYFAANYYQVDASMMITASHNPKEYNGFKFSYNGIHNAYGDMVREILEIITKGEFIDGVGSSKESDITIPYINLLLDKIKLGDRKLKVVYDCGNGTTSIIARKIFDKLNIESIALFDESDGTFPNHHPDPCVYENLLKLREVVLKEHANLGIGFDGDGDRVGFIDELGNMIETDKYLIIMWRNLANKVTNKACLFDVKCTNALSDELIKLNVKPIEYRTGNSYTRAGSYEGNYPLSGELSGHVYFRDKFPGYDDGIYAGIRLIEVLSYTTKNVSALLDGINKYYATPEIKVTSDDDNKFKVIAKMKEYCLSKNYNILTIDGVKVKFPDGFALVRASNTGPNITMRFEAKTQKRLDEIKEEFMNKLQEIIQNM